MNKRNKRFLFIGLFFFGALLVLGLGLKYFPFTKVIKLPSGTETELVLPRQPQARGPHTLYYDFEVAPGKNMPGGFYKGIAHSGQYSVKAFGQNSYSLTIERTAKEVGTENLKAVALSAWIYVFPTDNEVKGTFVFTASNELGVNVCWQGINLREPEVPRGRWFKISGYIDLTSVVFKPDYKIQVYFWNNSRTDILIDDYTIVFGGPVDRRGDSARVDMTKPAGFIPRFNEPPFPVVFLSKEGNCNTLNPDDFQPGNLVMAGDFMNTGNDVLFMINKLGKPLVYVVMPSSKDSRKMIPVDPAKISSIGKIRSISKGRFINGSGEQFLLFGEKGWIMGGILQNAIQIFFRSAEPMYHAISGDFNGDHFSELLSIGEDGKWKLMSFPNRGKSEGTWSIVSKEERVPVTEWNSITNYRQVFAGRFLKEQSSDVLLTIFRDKKTGKQGYSVRRYSTGQWISCVTSGHEQFGKTIGLDTLKPEDQFYVFAGGKNVPEKIYRYNRDWRFDLKEIRFNDSTFQTIAWVDFQGYEKDHNPKYYESLVLLPGNFYGPEEPGFLVVGKIVKERNYKRILPDFIQFYAIPKKTLK